MEHDSDTREYGESKAEHAKHYEQDSVHLQLGLYRENPRPNVPDHIDQRSDHEEYENPTNEPPQVDVAQEVHDELGDDKDRP